MSNHKIVDWSERRIKRRHKAHNLRVTIKAAGLIKWFSAAVPVFCIDINRYGMAIESSKSFKAKDKVLISFKGKYISHSNVPGVITECVDGDDGYRISIVFSYALDKKNYCRKTDNALSRIESLYSRHHQNTLPHQNSRAS